MTTLKTIKRIKHQLGIILLMSLATLQIANAQIEVDTNRKYSFQVKSGYGQMDCTVRAYASAFNTSYKYSFNMMKKNGRLDNTGFELGSFLETIRDNGFFTGMTKRFEAKLSIKDLVNNNVLNKDSSYIVYTKGHTFAVKYEGTEWVVYGNPRDMNLDIIYLVSVKKV
tara:strand:+ start:261 stop:764 length:504 start_codon:yes stop_codon:yes gene_type:complete